MITITSYLHRERLKDLIRRWMYNDPQPADAMDICRLVYFNNAFVARYLPVFSELVLTRLYPTPFENQKTRRKGELKDVIASHVPFHSPRIDELLGSYHSLPETFYRETPFHGTLYFAGGHSQQRFIGSSRIKRVRRMSEKSTRRIIDWIYASIKRRADELAQQRANLLGIPIRSLITPPQDMVEEFVKAESRLLEDLKNHIPMPHTEDLVIDDVAGIKVIVEDGDRQRFLCMMADMPGCEVMEVEPHAGRYNALNLIVQYRPDRQRLCAAPLGPDLTRLMQARGIAPEQAQAHFRDFVMTGEEAVNIEVIACDYAELLESEIGRCMHEDRILRQRQEQQYTGQLARNIEFLLIYLFAFPASLQADLGRLPIRLWNRYLPDYFDEVIRALFGIPSVEILE
jgi:hypothetical protein